MRQRNYAFIDSQNLNLGVRSLGWKLDYKKFRLYLKNKYNVEHAYIFIGMVDNNQELYTTLQLAGFILVFKPTIQYFQDDKLTVKGNVDAELVLYAAAIEYGNYDKAVIVSGDGDFQCLVRFLHENDKLLHLIAPTKYFSKLLREFSQYIVLADDLKNNIAYKSKSRDQRSVETLGLPGHGDSKIISKKTKQVKHSKQKDQRQRSVETLGVSGHGNANSVTKKKNPRKDGTLKRKSSIGKSNLTKKPAHVKKGKR